LVNISITFGHLASSHQNFHDTGGVENYWGFDGIKTPSTRARTKMLASFESHRFSLQWFALCQTNKVTFSTVKFKHFSPVLLYFAKLFRKIW